MTQPKLLELAKQGEPQAIAILMNRSLQPQGMSVKVTREGDRLSVLLQADQTPNRLVMTNFVRNGITNLKLQSVIQTVNIIGQRTGDSQPAWVQELQLSALDTPGSLLDSLDLSLPDAATGGDTSDAELESLPETSGDLSLDDLGGEALTLENSAPMLDESGFNSPDSASSPELELDVASDLGVVSSDTSDTSGTVDLEGLDLGDSSEFALGLDEQDALDLSTLELETEHTASADLSLDSDFSLDSPADSFVDLPSSDAENFDRSDDFGRGAFESDVSLGDDAEALDLSKSLEVDSLDASDLGLSNDLDFSRFDTDSSEGFTLGADEPESAGLDGFGVDEFNAEGLSFDAVDDNSAEAGELNLTTLDEAIATSEDWNLESPPADDADLRLEFDEPSESSAVSADLNSFDTLSDSLELGTSPEFAGDDPGNSTELSTAEIDWSTDLQSPDADATPYEPPSELWLDPPRAASAPDDSSLADDVANLFADTLPLDDSSNDWDESALSLESVDGDRVQSDAVPDASASSLAAEVETLFGEEPPAEFGMDSVFPSEFEPEFDSTSFESEHSDVSLGADEPDVPVFEESVFGSANFGQDALDESAFLEFETREDNPTPTLDFTPDTPPEAWIASDEPLSSDVDLAAGASPGTQEADWSLAESPAEGAAADESIRPVDWETGAAIAAFGAAAASGSGNNDDGSALELSDLDRDDNALNNFADSSEDSTLTERFDLTAGDSKDTDAASGVVLDLDELDTALSPGVSDQVNFDLDQPFESEPMTAATTDAIPSEPEMSASSPIADLTPLTPDPDAADDWMATQNTVIDEGDLLFEIDEETLSHSDYTVHPELDDEIILTPNADEFSNQDEPEIWSGAEAAALPLVPPSEAEYANDGSALEDRYDPTYEAAPLKPTSAEPDAIAPPPAPPNTPSTVESSSGKKGLFATVAILIGLWLLGLLAFSLFRREPTPTPGVATTETNGAPDNAASSPDTSSPSAPASDNPLEDGLARGASAANLAQTARSADDWGLVASQWQQAIALFQAVPESSPDYATAQQKIAEYQSYLAVAEQRIASIPPVVETPPTAPARIAGEISCEAIATRADSPPLELSNVQLNQAGDSIQMVGCLTNHTEQPISAVSVLYQQPGAEGETPQQSIGRLDVQPIQPGETQPFRSDFPLAEGSTQVTIQSIFWNSPNAGEQMQEEVEVSVALE